MITLQKLFDALAFGEFANVAIGNSTTGTITEDKYPKIISSLNLGLVELYKRFKLKQKEIVVHQQPGVNRYYLRSDYLGDIGAMDNESYLEEQDDDPFEDDIIKILEAYDSTETPVPINDRSQPDKSLFILAPDTIKMKPWASPEPITLVYQASYPEIEVEEDFDPKEIKMYFPSFLLEPLLPYIASRAFKGKTSKAAEGEARMTNTFLYQFEAACKKIVDLGLALEEDSTDTRFEDNGWV